MACGFWAKEENWLLLPTQIIMVMFLKQIPTFPTNSWSWETHTVERS
jgi:hypothetical protein